MKITEQFILQQAPNPAAAANGKKLSQSGKFQNRFQNTDATVYWAECAGSGKNPYRTSIDFSNEGATTCRCSCPSRQFPCKHAVGLMYEILEEKAFLVGEIPADLAEKKAKQAARAAKKEEKAAQPDKPKRDGSAVRKKRVLKQLEGLELAEKLVGELLTTGVGSMAGSSAKSFEQVAKELGNYYLTGLQNAFSRIALEVEKMQKNPEQAEAHHARALEILISLHATIRKSRAFLNQKLETGNFSAEDSILFEALGGTWRLEELKEIGSFRENVRLVQLSFDVAYDEVKKEYIERGFWLDLDTGRIFQTRNLRPLKALKYVRADDSCFELQQIPVLYVYPGESNQRIRWENAVSRPITVEEQQNLPRLAAGLAETVKATKNQIKNTLLPKFLPAMIPVGRIGRVDTETVLEDPSGNRIVLRDRPEDGGDHATVEKLLRLPCAVPAGSAVFGLVFYDGKDRRICLHPYSVVTPEAILRLQY